MLDEKTIIQIAGLIIGALATGVMGLIGWGIKKLITAVYECVVEIKILREIVSKLTEEVKPIPKMQRDLNNLHQWRRDMTGTDGE